MSNRTAVLLGAVGALALAGAAQAASFQPYGMPIGLAAAKTAAAAAEAEVAKAGSAPDAIAIVDPNGLLIYFARMDDTQTGSVEVALSKARSAALFRRPTKAFGERLAKGATGLLGLVGAVPIEGGVPLVSNGKIVGAIGASGGTGEQDGKVAQAGADTLK